MANKVDATTRPAPQSPLEFDFGFVQASVRGSLSNPQPSVRISVAHLTPGSFLLADPCIPKSFPAL
ncbi:hypothetical protein CVT26_016157 [Gymnopilus dilepis]|uniref:Uncharacterized protein n=1 Tax=Gymnopilus dilepis TaxID=231916 RepID=A0A409XYZ3_9AGAR|nr:hypothetical protein CVT26_016157 [Gymnopilus dilepis]